MQVLRKFLCACVLIFLEATLAWASITGTISGIVTDASGSVVPGVTVTAINTQTAIRSVVKTDAKGFYSFTDLAVGTYNIQAEQKGFKIYEKDGIVVDANSAIRVDIALEVGTVAEKVTVSSDTVQVETQSTQMGEVINSEKLTAVPLDGRDFTNLLDLQPGVVPNAYAGQASEMGNRPVAGGSGNAGNQSMNGQREAANGFMINGANVEEGKNNGTAAIPNLDSLAEFRIITNNFDAEYGNYSGGQVNVVTKSGANDFHGDAFEFLRNTIFDARDYFANTPGDTAGKYNQNQFGGTLGGPIKKDRTFFFADYQGTRQIIGETRTTDVPSPLDITGNLSDGIAGTLGGSVNSDCSANPSTCWSQVLSNRLGYGVSPNEPYYQSGCTSTTWTGPTDTTGCVFPNQTIPMTAWSPVATAIIAKNYIPPPNGSFVNSHGQTIDTFTSNTGEQRLRDDKVGLRVDFNTRLGMLSGYYHGDDYVLHSPGRVAPGFGSLDRGRVQVAVVSLTKSFGSTSVNEARFSYLRSAQVIGFPSGGLGVPLSSLGFVTPWGPSGGISPISPSIEGVPSISLGSGLASIGVASSPTKQFNNTFQWQDNYTKIIGRHSLKFGGQFHYDQLDDRNYFDEDGGFGFNKDETGASFASFLLGAPSSFTQASQQLLDSRSKYFGVFAQDSWRVTPDLTFNFGVRWEFVNPWYDIQNKLETIIPGVQSVVFPGAPTGYLVPGDPCTPGGAPGCIPSSLAPTQYHNFSPRLGLAYSPSADSGFIAKLTGGPGKTSIRLGYGIFYTNVEDLGLFQELGDAPYGEFYSSTTPMDLATPYDFRSSGAVIPQVFPFTFPPANVSAKNPDTTFPWATYEPISGALAYNYHNVTPRTEDYELSVQRQFGTNTVLSLSYVGNQGHHLVTELEANPGNEALCNQLNQPPFTPTPGTPFTPFCDGSSGGAENNNGNGPYVLPQGVTTYPSAATPVVETTAPCANNAAVTCNAINSLYTVLGPNMGDNPYISTIAQSSYKSLQVSVRHNSGLSSFLLGYTYSKCRDNASGLEEGVNPFNPRLSTGLCFFDVTHNFIGSYEQHIPFDRLFHATSGWANKLAAGWEISGITTFATGLPVQMSEGDDNSATGTQNTEAPIDLPNYTPGGGPLYMDKNPRHGNAYFNTNLFSFEGTDPISGAWMTAQIGNSPRTFFHGPGLNNWDLALLKDTKLTESKSLQFRFEAFNVFNHAQFSNPDGNIDDGTFGQVTSTSQGPRILQAALKFLF